MNNSPELTPSNENESCPSQNKPPHLYRWGGKDSGKILLLLGGSLIFLVIAAAVGGILFAAGAGVTPGTLFAKLKSLTLAREKLLAGEEEDRINVLLLGMGGAGHEGATLTDTIVVASIRPSDGKITLLSLPRDLQVLLPKYGYRRINSVNAFAELDEPGGGAQKTAAFISEILNETIHYYLRVDFTAFTEIINTAGGIEVEVERAFYDPFYPNENFGYAPVAFEAGLQRMDGERALKFVRSRHGTSGEGNDFARAKRQQKILLALKERLLSFDVLLRPKRLNAIFDSLENHLQTNIAFWEGMRFANLIRDIDLNLITTHVLDSSPQGLLRERNYNGAFVLEPKDQTWGEVRALVSGLLDESIVKLTPSPQNPTTLLPPPLTPPLGHELEAEWRTGGEISTISPPPGGGARGGLDDTSPPLVELQNGTFVNGLAARTAEKLESLGFDVISLGNAPVRDVAVSVIYKLNGELYPEKFTQLKEKLQAIDGEGEPRNILRKGHLDFLVILGANTP